MTVRSRQPPEARPDADVGLDAHADRDRRIRLLLGASDDDPVAVTEQGAYVEYDCRCCGGWETYVEVSAGDKERRFEELSMLESQLAYVDLPAQTEETLSPYLARNGEFHVRE